MIRGTTDSGYDFETNENIVKDFLFVKAYRMTNDKDPFKQIDGFTDMISMLLGDKEEEYYKFLREHFDGIVPVEVVGRDVGNIIQAIEKESEAAKK